MNVLKYLQGLPLEQLNAEEEKIKKISVGVLYTYFLFKLGDPDIGKLELINDDRASDWMDAETPSIAIDVTSSIPKSSTNFDYLATVYFYIQPGKTLHLPTLAKSLELI